MIKYTTIKKKNHKEKEKHRKKGVIHFERETKETFQTFLLN